MSEVLTGSPAGIIYGAYASAVVDIDSKSGDAYRAWEAHAVPDRKRDLLTAAAAINRMSWVDAVNTFALRDAYVLADGVTHPFRDASYELAALIAADPDVVTVADQGTNIQIVGAGGAGVTYFNPTSSRSGSAPVLPPILMALIGQYLAASSTSGPDGGSGQSGSCENPFSGRADYDRRRPW